jgi:DNA end-binding protein Ku
LLPKSVSFPEMTKSGHRIRHKRVDERTGREVDDDAIVKGYERTKGTHALVEPEELNAAAPTRARKCRAS